MWLRKEWLLNSATRVALSVFLRGCKMLFLHRFVLFYLQVYLRGRDKEEGSVIIFSLKTLGVLLARFSLPI